MHAKHTPRLHRPVPSRSNSAILLPPPHGLNPFVVLPILTHQSFQLKLLRIPQPRLIRPRNMSVRRRSRRAIHFWQRRGNGPGVGGVELEEHGDEKEEEEGDAVEEEDVGDMRDVSGGEEGHLFFGSSHEEEAGRVEELCGRGSQRLFERTQEERSEWGRNSQRV